LSGGQCLHLRGAQADGKTVAATWYAPEHFTRRQVDAIFDQLTQGVRLTLDGYWSTATKQDQLALELRCATRATHPNALKILDVQRHSAHLRRLACDGTDANIVTATKTPNNDAR